MTRDHGPTLMYRTQWKRKAINIVYHPEWFKDGPPERGIACIEIEAASPDDALPISGCNYYSAFVNPSDIEAMGGAIAATRWTLDNPIYGVEIAAYSGQVPRVTDMADNIRRKLRPSIKR